jgi:hypothetical protein
MTKLSSSLQKKLSTMSPGGEGNLITDDFSKPKNKLPGSRILPEAAQSIKILKVMPHFKDSKLIYRWTQ